MENLNKNNFEEKTKEGIVLISFSAFWCAPCKILKPILENLTQESEGKYKIFYVDVDEEVELVQQFGVRSVPTVIAFKAGKVVKTNIGSTTKENLLKMLE